MPFCINSSGKGSHMIHMVPIGTLVEVIAHEAYIQALIRILLMSLVLNLDVIFVVASTNGSIGALMLSSLGILHREKDLGGHFEEEDHSKVVEDTPVQHLPSDLKRIIIIQKRI